MKPRRQSAQNAMHQANKQIGTLLSALLWYKLFSPRVDRTAGVVPPTAKELRAMLIKYHHEIELTTKEAEAHDKAYHGRCSLTCSIKVNSCSLTCRSVRSSA